MVESAIAEQLGVSRTPVREALNRLTVEGWLEARRNKGVVVAGITPREVEERYALRELLEGYAASMAATRMTAEEVARLESICDAAEAALEDEQAAEFARLNDVFHQAILQAAGNETLLSIWHQYLQPARHAVFTLGSKKHRRQFVRGHRKLLSAIRRRASEAAEKAMREHLHYAMQIYLSDNEPA